MAVHVGKSGVVKNSTGAVGEVRSWTINETGETTDATTMGSGNWRTNVATFNSWTAEIECFYDDADTVQGGFTVGATIDLAVQPTGSTSGEPEFSGDAIVTGCSTAGAVDGLVTANLSLTVTGALVKGTVS
ncbi:phage tail tube protein [Acuticoccus mangrovi]|uniref:Phage tail protein n=1 Tax=Acuticoccus mangrovi TaxID=2796142 RepID=A0A934MGB6_9HYPH|nr:phage tail tube protein [Acuticoccus mangrovi]MBJ3776398.1 hypothetical protein [Acuticoccus mangrovi]